MTSDLLYSLRDALIPFATDSTMGSYVGMTNFGDYGGIAYQPAVCGNMAQRTAVVKNGYSDMETAEVRPWSSPVVPNLSEVGDPLQIKNKFWEQH